MSKSSFYLTVMLIFVFTIPAVAARKEYSRIITVNDYTYEIEVGGFRDPVNETIIIENVGDKPIVNPRISVNGKHDWFDTESIALEASRGCTTDEERSFAIFNFVRNNSQHWTEPTDRENYHPVVFFNVYGYGECSYHAAACLSLARSLGMKARVWEVWRHTVSEFWYNSDWHMLDSDIEIYNLMDDNRTVASVDQLIADQKVTGGLPENAHLTKFSGRVKSLKRVYTDVEGNVGHQSQRGVERLGACYFFDEDFWVENGSYDNHINKPLTMAMSIRPNEKLIRNWKGGPKYYDYKKTDRNDYYNGFSWQTRPELTKPIRYGDGQIIWTPDLTSKDARSFLAWDWRNSFKAEDGLEPALHVKYKHGGAWQDATIAAFGIRSPYAITGGKFKAKVYRGAASEWDRIGLLAVRQGGCSKNKEKIWEAPEGATGYMDIDVDLDEFLYPSGNPGNHLFGVSFRLYADEKNDPPTQTGVESIQMVADIQCAPNSLPTLSLGKNIIRYRDETPGPHKVKVTHIWRERTDNHPPRPPKKALYPEDGAVVDELAPLFRWPAASDADKKDRIVDYYFTISLDPDCRWPLSTSLMTETGSTKPEWNLADGWLNRDTTYYWKVKAKDSRGVWGNWSPVFKFKTVK